jgi:hypothetical protein
MSTATDTDPGDSTTRANAAILAAVREQHDFAGWLAAVLASVAACLGSSDGLIACRPGSWHVDLIRQLVKGAVRWRDEFLNDYATERS